MDPPLPYTGFSSSTVRPTDPAARFKASQSLSTLQSSPTQAPAPPPTPPPLRTDAVEFLADLQSGMAAFLGIKAAPQHGNGRPQITWTGSPRPVTPPVRTLADGKPTALQIPMRNTGGRNSHAETCKVMESPSAVTPTNVTPTRARGVEGNGGSRKGLEDPSANLDETTDFQGSFSTWVKFPLPTENPDTPTTPLEQTKQEYSYSSPKEEKSNGLRSTQSPKPIVETRQMSQVTKGNQLGSPHRSVGNSVFTEEKKITAPVKETWNIGPSSPKGMTHSRARELGLGFQQKGDYPEALKHFNLAIQLYEEERLKGKRIDLNDLMLTYAASAKCQKELGEFTKAINTCCTALRVDPASVLVFECRASSFEALGQYKDALKDYEILHRLVPSSLLFTVGLVRLKKIVGGT